MSWNPAFDPGPLTTDPDAIETLIVPRTRDLGGFEVRRALPAAQRRMVGPFVFFDQMGPAEFVTGAGIDVRPHPHIGLGTVTYLLNGHFIHKDSLGTDQKIVPGEVNWMIAGRGITHSERTDPLVRQGPHDLFGVQTWLALPEDREDMSPAFEHFGKGDLPMLEAEGKRVRLILGTAWGEKAPVSTFGGVFYADAVLEAAPGSRCRWNTRTGACMCWRARSPWPGRCWRRGRWRSSAPAMRSRCRRDRRAHG